MLKFCRSSTKLSHIIFTNDMVLLGDSTNNQMEMILDCLNTFYKALGKR